MTETKYISEPKRWLVIAMGVLLAVFSVLPDYVHQYENTQQEVCKGKEADPEKAAQQEADNTVVLEAPDLVPHLYQGIAFHSPGEIPGSFTFEFSCKEDILIRKLSGRFAGFFRKLVGCTISPNAP